ncbi:apolipoprotein A-I-like [Vanacampus margaritifer]
MKFVALAVTLLLAVGCQAASLPADTPTALQHARATLDIFMTQMKESAQRALSHLDDTEYKGFKDLISARMDYIHAQVKAAQTAVSPITDGVYSTISEITATFRENVQKDIENLEKELEPHRTKLNEVVNKHLEDYRKLLEPVVNDYETRHKAEMEALKNRLEPVMDELRLKVNTNIEETKNALIPMIEAVRVKVTARLEEVKSLLSPYVDEYKDQIGKAYNQAKSVTPEDLTAMRAKIDPLVEDVKGKLQTIVQTIVSTFNPPAEA